MGASYSSFVVVGFEVIKEHFWKAVPGPLRCPRGHESAGKFCSECGGAMSAQPLYEATPLLRRFLDLQEPKYAPMSAWDPHDDNLNTNAFGGLELLWVNSYQDCETTPSVMALGVNLLEFSNIGEGRGQASKTLDVSEGHLLSLIDKVTSVKQRMLYTGDVRLFLSGYCSY